MPLDTLARVKLRLGVVSPADDALLGRLMESAEGVIGSHCQRDFAGGTFTEYAPGDTRWILLRNYPVSELVSLKVDPGLRFGPETTLPADQYTLHAERGVVQSLSGPFVPRRVAGFFPARESGLGGAPRCVQVVYATPAHVPAEVQEAHARLVGGWYREVKTHLAQGFAEIQQQKLGDTFVIFGPGPSPALPGEVERLLQRHRVPAL